MIAKENVFPGKLLRRAKVGFKFDKICRNLKSCLKNTFELIDYQSSGFMEAIFRMTS